MVTLTVLLFTSCASLTPERIQILSAIAGQAAQIGAQQWLAKHPEHRAAFDSVIIAITALVKAGVTNQTAYAELLQSLPTATLAAPAGELYVTEDRLVIWDAELNKAVAVTGAAEQPVIRAAVAGLKRGVAPTPPLPGKAKKALVAAPVSVAPSSPAPPSAAAVLQPLSRTNVTRSVVNVEQRPGSASDLTVRWQLGPRSVYHVEHGNGTNWYRFGCLTNLSATGPTNWVTVWPPTLPAGVWRVLRVR